MSALTLTMTTAGLGRFTAAQVQDDIDLTVAAVAFTAADFVVAPTLTALPGEFRRVGAISGNTVGDNVVHMIVRDEAPLGYTVRGFGLFLADGTLFAVYGQSTPIFEKSPLTTLLMPLDIAFPTTAIDKLIFGDANFLNPPATTETKGVVELATPAETAALTDRSRAITPASLKNLIDTLSTFLVPIGAIALWSGAGVTPGGWAICDGRTVARTDGRGDITTPDLRDRVPVGAGGAREVGEFFGAAEMTVRTAAAGGHTPAGSMPRHAHGFSGAGTAANAQSEVQLNQATRMDTAQGGTGRGVISASLNDPGHGHAVEVAGTTDETEPIALQMEQVPAHDHEVTVDVHQPSFALHYIMKI